MAPGMAQVQKKMKRYLEKINQVTKEFSDFKRTYAKAGNKHKREDKRGERRSLHLLEECNKVLNLNALRLRRNSSHQ